MHSGCTPALSQLPPTTEISLAARENETGKRADMSRARWADSFNFVRAKSERVRELGPNEFCYFGLGALARATPSRTCAACRYSPGCTETR